MVRHMGAKIAASALLAIPICVLLLLGIAER